MKQLIIIIALLHSVVLLSQENENLYILKADSTWLKEVIKFPLEFAEDIDFEGYEDLRFAKNWSNPESSEFFTYAFVWNVNLSSSPTLELVTTNMKLYYDGLMTAVNKDKNFEIPKTIVDFQEIKETSELPVFNGEMKVYDAFFTKDIIELNVTVKITYCKEQNKYVLLFRISTLDYQNKIWNKLNAIKLADNHCEK
ncbi:hypothetical protein [uncultured Winogradskyella sp.]|uniref:hypothetical protein n=1 Tax=uncultured Winogradskyella sp. TaxID=395353 RepID=UPI00262E8AE2|nr:hypothetical protein [uncultured Winogradskyella sp.]